VIAPTKSSVCANSGNEVTSILGAVPWVMLLVWGGLVLGDNWGQLKSSLRGLDYLIALVLLALVGLFVWRHVRRA